MIGRADPPLRPWAVQGIEMMLAGSKGLLFVDAGGGKTRAVLEAFAQSREYCDAERMLVIAPMRVAAHTWPAEIAEWEYDFRWQLLTTKTESIDDAEIYLVHFEALPWLFGKPDLKRKRWLPGSWDLLDWPAKPDWVHVDEVHHFKRASGVRAKTYAKYAPSFARRTGGTGSPAANGYEGLHGILKAVDGGVALGSVDPRDGVFKTGITEFRRRYFDAVVSGRRSRSWTEFTLKHGAAQEIEDAIRPLVTVATDDDWEDELPRVETHTVAVELPPEAIDAYRLMRREAVMEAGGTDLVFAEEARNTKLRQICNGCVYTSRSWEPNDGRYEQIHTAKLDLLPHLLAEGPALVVYEFKHDRDEILDSLRGWDIGTLDGTDDYDTIARWNRGELAALVIYPSEGLNLQKGGNRIIWYGPPHDWKQYDQTNRRLIRLGQPADVVHVYNLCATGTIERDIGRNLAEKERVENRLKEKLK